MCSVRALGSADRIGGDATRCGAYVLVPGRGGADGPRHGGQVARHVESAGQCCATRRCCAALLVLRRCWHWRTGRRGGQWRAWRRGRVAAVMRTCGAVRRTSSKARQPLKLSDRHRLDLAGCRTSHSVHIVFTHDCLEFAALRPPAGYSKEGLA